MSNHTNEKKEEDNISNKNTSTKYFTNIKDIFMFMRGNGERGNTFF
jgi:hypothetical protein